jgi:biopolymer transport protein ExbB
MYDIVMKGGPLMWPIILCSVISIAIIADRAYVIYRAGAGAPGLFTRVKALYRTGKQKQALELCEGSPLPEARVLAVGMRLRGRSEGEKEKLISRAGSRMLRGLERNLRGLGIIGNITPLLGLTGTVTGMIRAFRKIQEAGGGVDPSMLAGGIWEALITTAAGLVVAIPTLVAYHYFEGRIDDISSRMKDAAAGLLEFGDDL